MNLKVAEDSRTRTFVVRGVDSAAEAEDAVLLKFTRKELSEDYSLEGGTRYVANLGWLVTLVHRLPLVWR